MENFVLIAPSTPEEREWLKARLPDKKFFVGRLYLPMAEGDRIVREMIEAGFKDEGDLT